MGKLYYRFKNDIILFVRREIFINPALWDRKKVGAAIEKTGARVFSLGDGFNGGLEEILTCSLLGPNELRETKNFSPWEQELLKLPREGYRIITICDFDGVFTDPLQGIFSGNERTISLRDFRILREILKASDASFLLTSRIDPDLIRERFPFLRWLINRFERSGIDNFPFFNQSAVTKLERRSKNKLAVVIGKSLKVSERTEQIRKIIEKFIDKSDLPFIIYIIGSSIFDRRAVLRLCQNNPQWAQRIVFFDTGHLVL